ncbi:MAG: Ig-like domain-containing protein, partial [Euryarchaeota archaeon]|nr:Ig-like domain-containing protein [Euryarchaeota archaeon]
MCNKPYWYRNRLWTHLIFLGITLIVGCAFATQSLASNALVTWDPSPGPNVAGYVVYYGTQSRQYEYEEDCGDILECKLFSLDDQTTYYIAVRAYNWVDQFSDYSNEVVFNESSDPIANDDFATTDENTAVTVDVIANDTDNNGAVDPTSVAISVWPSHGTADNNLDGTITYTPDTGYLGADSLMYTVDDNDGATSNVATLEINTSLFSDDFRTDTTGEYTITHTWTDGGVGQFLYDSVDARVQVLTGNDVELMFSQDVPVLNSGIFGMDFLPTQKYPSGGVLCLRLVQDENNYYEIKNSDGYGTQEIKKVVNGAKVASVFFQSEYTQKNNYHITITFSPDSTTVEAFGDVLTLSGNSDSISVGTFEVRSMQQDAYYDNIFYTDSDANESPVADDDSATTNEDTAVTVNVVANDTDTDGTVDPTSVALSIWPSHGTAYNNLDGTITY